MRIVGRARDCVRRSLAKVLSLEEINFGVTVSFVRLVVFGRGVCVSIKVAQR